MILPQYLPDSPERIRRNNTIISVFCLCFSLAFFVGTAACMLLYGDTIFEVLKGLHLIMISPSKLITDYFEIGGISATFLNAGLCGLASSLLIWINKTPASSLSLAGYFLVVAHTFYGLNIFNMWPCFLGVFVYCLVFKKKLGENLHFAFFATCLGPFISEFIFRYTIGNDFEVGKVKITVLGVALALLASLLFGFIVPSLIPGTTKMHRGFNLYKAGLAIGLFGFFIYEFFFKTLGVDAVGTIRIYNEAYENVGRSYPMFYNIFFGSVFIIIIFSAVLLLGGNVGSYKKIIMSSGHDTDFARDYGMELSLLNIGIYGIFMMIYFNLVIFFTDGEGFTGPTFGILLAAITFASAGQHPKNVLPIMLGYAILSGISTVICLCIGKETPYTLSSQVYMNGLAFATGLCPFSGVYGYKIGILAGFVSAIICTSTASLHGGFMLYNGGFTAGLTALLLIPILDFYNVKTKE